MKEVRNIFVFMLVALFAIPAKAQVWRTHFAYNNVTQIAMAQDKVFAISDGSLFSVDKQSEQIKMYNNQSGLHGTGITCIHYDNTGKQLLIGYATGKIDILSSNGVQYISALYDKDMTQRKTIYNITIKGRTAYLSTAYGVQTMDLRENKLVDSYWLRPNGEETAVKDVMLTEDSIYAFTDDTLFCASLQANLVDYTFWHREKAGRVSPDSEKGTHYQDATDHWYAAQAEGIVRFTPTERLSYKPQGPLTNIPYYVSAAGDQVFMLSGGRWTSQNHTPGNVMRYQNKTWHNITAESIHDHTQTEVLDMMNVAVDPTDANHYFVTSYGTGLYEFRGDRFISRTLANGVITSAVADEPNRYTRLQGARFDQENRLWFLNAGNTSYPVIIKEDTTYSRLPLMINGQPLIIKIPADLLIDHRNPNHKWIGIAYKNMGLVLLDDHGTPLDASDDRTCLRAEWTNQHSHTFKPVNLLNMMQDRQGRLWLATEQGTAYIDANTDFFSSDAIIQPDVTDNNGENPVTSQRVTALCQAQNGEIWVGTEALGVYVLNEEATELVAHYTTDNSAMSANGIMSLTVTPDGQIFIGTSEGLVEYDPKGKEDGLNESEDAEEYESEEGSMLRWRLHLSYANAQQIEATPQQMFAVANGSLFSVDKTTDELIYWSKATGLNGTSVSSIAHDPHSGKLVVAYENGQIDLVDGKGNVTPMPDISMKAGSMAVTVNSICIGSQYVYLSMPFGIIAMQARKGEISDTYYIGADAASVPVQHVVELGDTLYAFSYDRLYKASLHDNVVDYSYWHSETIPFEQADQVAVYRDALYVLADESLYRREGTNWHFVAKDLNWIHSSGSQLLAYQANTGFVRLTDDDQWQGLSNRYTAVDGLYSNGEYWLAEEGKGLVRLGTEGDDVFLPEGPLSNFGYHLDIAHDRLYVAPGGRWAEQYGRQSSLSIYDGQQWTGIPWPDTWYYTGHDIRDAVQYAVDPTRPDHFFVTTYGTGVFEFDDYKAVQHYDSANSTLRKAAPETSDYYYTRTDGAMTDEQGNVWILNATSTGRPLHIRTPMGQWIGLRLQYNGKDLQFSTPAGIWTDQRKNQWKWMLEQRGEPRVVLLDDGGTPTMSGDDRCVARSSFVDANGNTLSPANFRCLAQDQTNRIWIGTDKGIILIPKTVDFFTSNACQRIIIPRNDGTGLGDYLLGDEQINSLAVDGGNRIWIGTENSGLYLIEDDTITVAHFTETNSLLPSNRVQSVAIMPKTGEVFVGTDRGIASYRSDASEAQADMSGAYAYPNPVRPDYVGVISITGLMENTVVNIIDAGGNLVCKTRSHGGTAVWDGKLPNGRRATPGVYTAMCNAQGGHTVVKILVIR